MTAFSLRTTFTAAAISAVMLAGPAPAFADNNLEGNDSDARLVIYFTRHAEKQTVTKATDTVPPGYSSTPDADPFFSVDDNRASVGDTLNEVCGKKKCAEELSKQGLKRALLLADWFAGRGITNKLDAVYATHKTRTQQTVMPTATVADLEVTALGLDLGYSELSEESTTPSECLTLQAIENAQTVGYDTILIAGHSGTLYDIMGNGVEDCGGLDGLGLDTGNTAPDTGNPDRFPKDDEGKVENFGDIWKVVIKRNGEVKFKYRVNLQQPEKLKIDNFAR